MHRPEYETELGETLSALSDLVQAGKIRAFGSSMFPAELITEAQWVAERQGCCRFLTEQPMYSIFTRKLEGAVLPTAQRYALGVLTFSPLNSGWLSGHADPTSGHRASLRPSVYDPSTPTGQLKDAALANLAVVAGEAGMALPQLATAFVRAHPAVTSVLIGRARTNSSTGFFLVPISSSRATSSIASTRSSRRELISTPRTTARRHRRARERAASPQIDGRHRQLGNCGWSVCLEEPPLRDRRGWRPVGQPCMQRPDQQARILPGSGEGPAAGKQQPAAGWPGLQGPQHDRPEVFHVLREQPSLLGARPGKYLFVRLRAQVSVVRDGDHVMTEFTEFRCDGG